MPTDTERREVARRLRHAWVNVPDTNRVRHHLRVLYEVYEAVGIADDKRDAIDLFDRLADLIEPDEPKVRCAAEVKIDGDRLERLARDAAVELTGIDRDALLALADSLDRSADLNVYPRERGGGVPIIEDELAELKRHVARCIREACGEEA